MISTIAHTNTGRCDENNGNYGTGAMIKKNLKNMLSTS